MCCSINEDIYCSFLNIGLLPIISNELPVAQMIMKIARVA